MRVPLAVPPGLISDETTYALPGRYADGNNVRFWNGRPQVIGGWASMMTSTLTGVCRNLLAWADISARETIAFGTHSALQVRRDGTLYTITPSGLATGEIDTSNGYGSGGYGDGPYGTTALGAVYARTWGLQTFGEYLLANPRGGTLYVWQNNTASLATEVGQAPDIINSILVTPQRQVLALGANEYLSGIYNPMCIRVSDIETYDTWNIASDNNADEIILQGGGRIVAGKNLGGFVAVWTDTGLHLGQYIGSTDQSYRFDQVATNCGAIGPNAVTVIGQTAFWMTPDLQVYAYTVGSPPFLVPCPIRDEFAQNVEESQSTKIVACPVSKFSEVWFFYPDARDGIENSRYIALSTAVPPGEAWFRGDLARTAAVDAGAQRYPTFVTYAGNVYEHENGNSADGGVLSWDLTTTDFYLGEAERRFLVKGLWPDFEGQIGPVSLTVETKAYPQDSTSRTFGPYSLAVGSRKRDFMGEGRVAAITLSGSSAPSYMRLGKPSLDVVATGQQ